MTIAFKKRIDRLLRQGLGRHQLALAVCLGVTIGCSPLAWGTSLLCILLAGLFRLNQVAVQGANYLAWPLQVALIYPYFYGGMKLAGEQQPMLLDRFRELLAAGPVQFVEALAWYNAWALLVWAVTAPLLAAAAYGLSRWLFRLQRRREIKISSTSNLILTRQL